MKNIEIIITKEDVAEFNRLYFDEHPRARNPLIKAPFHPSLNEYMNLHYKSLNRTKQNWRDFIIYILKKRNLAGMHIEKCRITYRTFFKQNRRHDLDNITPKFIFDGFVEADFIVDDDLKHIVSLTTEGGIDKNNPRIEFIVEILE